MLCIIMLHWALSKNAIILWSSKWHQHCSSFWILSHCCLLFDWVILICWKIGKISTLILQQKVTISTIDFQSLVYYQSLVSKFTMSGWTVIKHKYFAAAIFKSFRVCCCYIIAFIVNFTRLVECFEAVRFWQWKLIQRNR